MGKISYWYSGLGHGVKTIIAVSGIVLAVAVVIAILYMALTPQKVVVRYGTIVWDPLDGHVWEDNTQTIWVNTSEAGNYKVERIEQYSPEHEKMLAEAAEKVAQLEKKLNKSSGFESIETAFPSDAIAQLDAFQQSIETAGQDIITGMEMANKVDVARATLLDYRGQVASIELPTELETLRAQTLEVLDLYIDACDLYLDAIASGDLSLADEANLLIQQANGIVQDLIPSY
jgi:hypothetical protein